MAGVAARCSLRFCPGGELYKHLTAPPYKRFDERRSAQVVEP